MKRTRHSVDRTSRKRSQSRFRLAEVVRVTTGSWSSPSIPTAPRRCLTGCPPGARTEPPHPIKEMVTFVAYGVAVRGGGTLRSAVRGTSTRRRRGLASTMAGDGPTRQPRRRAERHRGMTPGRVGQHVRYVSRPPRHPRSGPPENVDPADGGSLSLLSEQPDGSTSASSWVGAVILCSIAGRRVPGHDERGPAGEYDSQPILVPDYPARQACGLVALSNT